MSKSRGGRRTALLAALAVLLLVATVIVVAQVRDDESSATTANQDTSDSSFEPAELKFTVLDDMEVTVDGATTSLGDSPLDYQRGDDLDVFDDPATPEYDGVHVSARKFVACKSFVWTMGAPSLASDIVALGVHRDDPSLIEKGIASLDWGVARPLDDSAVHLLERECDGHAVADPGETHHTAQWLAALGRATKVLVDSDYADDYRPEIEAYTSRMEEIARLLVREDNWRRWQEDWLVDQSGNDFTHKTFMMASGLALTASLTDNATDAERWSAVAADIARRGIDNQWDNGVNPERGGPDVAYQMYGTWLAQLYLSTLPTDSPLAEELAHTIDDAIAWQVTRIDPDTGEVDIEGSTRVCVTKNTAFDAADTVRVLLLWGYTQPDREDLIDLAILVDAGQKATGNPCPEDDA